MKTVDNCKQRGAYYSQNNTALEKNKYEVIRVTDSRGHTNCILYDRTKENTFQKGNSVIFMNYFLKIEPTKNSKVRKTSNLEVSQELLDRAELIANLAPAETTPI